MPQKKKYFPKVNLEPTSQAPWFLENNEFLQSAFKTEARRNKISPEFLYASMYKEGLDQILNGYYNANSQEYGMENMVGVKRLNRKKDEQEFPVSIGDEFSYYRNLYPEEKERYQETIKELTNPQKAEVRGDSIFFKQPGGGLQPWATKQDLNRIMKELKRGSTVETVSKINPKYNINDISLDNYHFLGMDNFGTLLREGKLKLPGWMKEGTSADPKHFYFTGGYSENEAKEKNPEVRFTNMYNAIAAKGSLLNYYISKYKDEEKAMEHYIGGNSPSNTAKEYAKRVKGISDKVRNYLNK